MKNNDLNQIRMFAKVAQLHSFTKAAEALGIEKSTVSNKITQLETRLNIRLLQRTTRSVSLTDAGQQYLTYCEQALAALSMGESYIAELSQVPTGCLRVSTPQNFIDFVMPSLITPFLKEYPEVQLEIIQSNRNIDLIKDGFDIAVRSQRDDIADSSLIYRKIRHTEWIMVASPGFIEQYGIATTPTELAALPSIGSNNEVIREQYHKEIVWQGEKVRLNHRLSVNSVNSICQGVLEGLGIAFLPKTMASANLESGRLIQIHPEIELSPSKLYVVYPSRSGQPAKVRAFVDALIAWSQL